MRFFLDLLKYLVYTTLYSTYLNNNIRRNALKRQTWSIEEIEELREKLNLTQEEFSREIPVCLNTYRRWKQGKFNPNRKAVRALNKLSLREQANA